MKKTFALILAVVILTAGITSISTSAVGIKKIAKIKQTAATTTTVTIKWSKVASNLKYDIKVSNGKNAKRTYKNISKNTYTIPKLKAGKTYAVKVRAKKGGVKSEWSNVFKVTTSPNVTYQWDKGKLTAKWTKVKKATSYALRVELNFNKKKYVRIKNIKDNTYTISYKNLEGLSINKVYNIIVRPYIDKTKLFTGKVQTRDIEITGHRGRMDIAPENTMASFEQAYKSYYDSVEADFWETKSGDILISHNNILTMCNSTADIRTLSASTIKNYPIKKGTNVSKYKTQYLPTLEQLIKSISGWNMQLYLHLKDPNMSDNGLKLISATIKKYGMSGKVTVFSSNKSAFERIVKQNIRAGFLTIPNSTSDITNAISYAKSKKASVVIFKFTDSMNDAAVKYAHSKKLKIGCYNISTADSGSRFSNMGGDFLITNKYFFK